MTLRILSLTSEEPLPADSRFWTHPKVVLTPHNAADTDPDEISKYVAQQIERFERDLAAETPPASRIDSLTLEDASVLTHQITASFPIKESSSRGMSTMREPGKISSNL